MLHLSTAEVELPIEGWRPDPYAALRVMLKVPRRRADRPEKIECTDCHSEVPVEELPSTSRTRQDGTMAPYRRCKPCHGKHRRKLRLIRLGRANEVAGG